MTPVAQALAGTDLDQLSINTIRTLSIDAVQQAKSGHPGTPMALAPLVYTIWNRVMRFDPQDPIWPNRDRFVLSNGHASMLLWSVLHLTRTQAVNSDYEILGQPSVTLDDIRRFRHSIAKRRGTRNITGFPVWKRPPVRWGRAWPPVWAWRSRRSGWRIVITAPGSRFSTIRSTAFAGTGA
jgi:hypothetical protein